MFLTKPNDIKKVLFVAVLTGVAQVGMSYGQERDIMEMGAGQNGASPPKIESFDSFYIDYNGDEEEDASKKKKKPQAKSNLNGQSTLQKNAASKKLKKTNKKIDIKPTSTEESTGKDVASFNFVYYLIQKLKLDDVMH